MHTLARSRMTTKSAAAPPVAASHSALTRRGCAGRLAGGGLDFGDADVGGASLRRSLRLREASGHGDVVSSNVPRYTAARLALNRRAFEGIISAETAASSRATCCIASSFPATTSGWTQPASSGLLAVGVSFRLSPARFFGRKVGALYRQTRPRLAGRAATMNASRASSAI